MLPLRRLPCCRLLPFTTCYTLATLPMPLLLITPAVLIRLLPSTLRHVEIRAVALYMRRYHEARRPRYVMARLSCAMRGAP